MILMSLGTRMSGSLDKTEQRQWFSLKSPFNQCCQLNLIFYNHVQFFMSSSIVKELKLSIILLSDFHTFSKFRRSTKVTAKMWVKLLLLLPLLLFKLRLKVILWQRFLQFTTYFHPLHVQP